MTADVRLVVLADLLAQLDHVEVSALDLDDSGWWAAVQPRLCDSEPCQEYAHATEDAWLDIEFLAHLSWATDGVLLDAQAPHPATRPGRDLRFWLGGDEATLTPTIDRLRDLLTDYYRRGASEGDPGGDGPVAA